MGRLPPLKKEEGGVRAGGKTSSTCGGVGTWGAAAPFLVRPPDAPLLCVPHAGPALRHKVPPDSPWGGEQGMKVLGSASG